MVVALVGSVAAAAGACTGSTSPGPNVAPDASPRPAAGGAAAGTGTDLLPPDPNGTAAGDGASGTTQPAAGAAATPPAAAELPWLAGPRTSEGVVLGESGMRLWQGSRAGERAVLGSGWYRYFGPDGSVVGCVSDGACVGVGADGTVAVTTGPHEVRNVYRADGAYLGRFAADGKKVGAAPDPPALADALAATGVDVAALVNAATAAAPFAGGVTGDPHFLTAGGQRFTTQLIGQFVARGGDPTHVIQLQLEPMAHRDDVSIVSAVAIGTGANVVTVDASGVVTVDGRPQARLAGIQRVSLGGGVVLGRWPADASGASPVAVLWPDGSSVVASTQAALGITMVANIFPRRGTAGLLGAVAAPAGADLVARGGAGTSVPSAIESWRVTAGERLLPAQSGALPTFPRVTATVDPGAAKIAEQLCTTGGLTDRADRSACAFDVGLTGDTGFVAGHLALSAAAEAEGVSPLFAARWPALLAPPAAAIRDLPADGQLDLSLGAAQVEAFRLSVGTPGVVRLVYRAGCSGTANPPGMDQPAVRVFDAAGHAVSDRIAPCGHAATPALPAGDYVIAVANGTDRPTVGVRVDVQLP